MFLNKVIGAVALFASCAFSQDVKSNQPGLRGLQDMGERWRIGDAIFNWDKDNKEFRLAWEISDAIQDSQYNYKIFDNVDCNIENGGQDITLASGDPTHNNFYLYTSGLKGHQNQPYDATSDGSGFRTTFLHLALQTTKLPDMTIWDDENSQIKFCVRYMLHTDATEAIEVNYQEVLVELDVEMTNGFEVTAISVAPLAKTLDTVGIACNVEAYICDSNNDLDAGGRIMNQGDEVRVCVKTTQETRDEGLWLEKINYFFFYRDFEDVLRPQVSQEAINEGGVMAPLGLTFYNCQPGEDPCGFDNILIADFYSVPGVGEVKGRGEAICQFGRDESRSPSAAPVVGEEEEDSQQPSIAPSIDSSSGPTIAFAEWIAVPTNEPNGDEEECWTYPIVIMVTDDDFEWILDDAFGITSLNDDNTAVNITVTQNFASQFDEFDGDESLHWMAMMYPSLSTGSNRCATEGTSVGGFGEDGEIMTVSALCHEAFADPIQLYVQLDMIIHDPDLPYHDPAIDLPEQCGEAPSDGDNLMNLGFSLFVPCGCATEYELRRALHRNGYITKKELNSKEPLVSKSGRRLKNLQKRRVQEEAEEAPPSPPFDMTFTVDGSADSFRASSAQMMGSTFLSLATTLSLLWGAASMFA